MNLYIIHSLLKAFNSKIVYTFTCCLFINSLLFAQTNDLNKKTWENMQAIVKSVKCPTFQNKTFNIMQYGAKADGLTDNTEAIHKAISACNKSGGGMVLVPKGKYLSHAIHLEDNINLHLDEGAEILFSTNPKEIGRAHV